MKGALLVAVAVAGLLLLVGDPRFALPRRPTRDRDADTSLLRRLRLPLAMLAGAAGWAFVGGYAGLAAGLALGVLAWRTLSNARAPSEIRRDHQLLTDYPLVVELLSCSLSAGADISTALTAVADAVGEPWASKLSTSLHALDVGQPPADVWAAMQRDPIAHGLGRVLSRSQATGVPAADAMRRLAVSLREGADLAAHAHARTIEVRAALPLGACFLPAFVLLGVVPLVADVLGDLAWIGQR